MTIYCLDCRWGEVVTVDIPACCPKCGGTQWRSAVDPTVPYHISGLDKRFLRSIRVTSEEG